MFGLPNQQVYSTRKLRDLVNSYLNDCDSRTSFTKYLQHDASEYLLCILEAISSKSFDNKIFGGTYKNIIECSSGFKRETGIFLF